MERLPSSRVPDPREAPVVRWGVLGPGKIAAQFVGSFQEHTRQRLVAVGSRDRARSENFVRRFGGEARSYGSYDEVLADPAVDVVYVAVPHSGHAELASSAIAAGKHVLVEKPFAMSRAQGERVVRAAGEAGVFVAEAMWPRFLPAYDVLRQLLAGGALGEVRSLVADLGEHFTPEQAPRLFDPVLGGGVRLDLGVYLVALASFVGGPATSVTARGVRTASGVDARFSALLRSERGVDATVFSTLESPTSTRAWIGGTQATAILDAPFYAPGRLTVTDVRGDWTLTQDFPQNGPAAGLAFEAAHVARCIADGLIESPLIPLAETLSVAATLDAIHRELGF